ncbi:MAG: PQQ-binding-like beta-propeller repeat protein [Saprospiraceae bacterium]|nr:hypothetical protein [Lewinella sp.]
MPGRNTLILIALLIGLGCRQQPADQSWSVSFAGIGTNASPRLADLNRDGIMDIIIGAGNREKEATEYGVMALNGRNGELLWKVSATDQIVGSPVFIDVTHDGVPDVFIGGRTANLLGIDGASGQVLWRYQPPQDKTGALQYAHFNFYTPQVVPDQNADGIPDLLVANGGNVAAPAHSRLHRYPGVLMVVNSRNGNIIAADTMPDGGETYMSPLVSDIDGSGDPSIFFGTGGETIGGSLYRSSLSDLMSGDLRATELLHTEDHGFIAPPVLIDITADQTADIVGLQHGGKLYAIDGTSNSLLWEHSFDGAEANTVPAPGYFNKDDTPDFFCHLSIGTWPDNRGTFQVLVDGRNGNVLYQDTLGCTGFYSPVTADLDSDGYDEALLSINDFNCTRLGVTDIRHQLSIFDFQQHSIQPFLSDSGMKNVSSTPCLGDLDGDGRLDIVYTIQANTSVLLEFFGLTVRRESTAIPVSRSIPWGAYLGTYYDGSFEQFGSSAQTIGANDLTVK